MNKFRFLTTTLFISMALWSHAQITQNIRGQVRDGDSKATLVGATVTVFYGSERKGAITDQEGNFIIENVPVGRVNITCQTVGFETRNFSQVELKSSKEMVLEIDMQESFATSGTVVVKAKKSKVKPINDMATLSARSFTVEETSRYAAAAFDPARMAQNFAGVSSGGDDLFNEIVVRGNSPKGVLWRLEGIEIANPNHFSAGGGQGGAISMLSSSTLGNSDFFTGAFPAEYGNALSGVFDLKFRKGNNEQRENSFMLGALGIELATEGPFSKNYGGSYLINYRYSTLGFLSVLGVNPVGDILPAYQDLSYNIYLPTEKMGNFSVFGVMGANESVMEESFNPNDTSEQAMDDYDHFTEKELVNISGLKHQISFGKRAYLQTVASYSQTNFITFDQVLEIDTNSFTAFAFQEDDVNNTFYQTRISSMFNYKMNTRNSFRAGIIGAHLSYDFKSRFSSYEDDTTYVVFDNSNSSNQYQAYAQWKLRLTKQLTLNSGFHYTHLQATNSKSFEPRIAMSYKVNPKATVSIAAGKHSKPEHLSIYLYEQKDTEGGSFQPNKNLEMSKAWHYVVAFDYSLNPNLRLKAEAYYQSLFDIPISVKPNTTSSLLNASDFWDAIFRSDSSSFVNDGTGTNIGIDLTLERFFNNNFYYLVTGSVFNSTYKTNSGETYNTRYNGKYQFNVLGGKEFILKNKNRRIGVNLKVNTFGGNRYTPILLEESIADGGTVRDKTKPFGAQVPDYFRFDCGVSYKFNRANSTHSIMLDIQNATGRDNIGGTYYDSSKQEIGEWTLTGFFPFFNYRIEF